MPLEGTPQDWGLPAKFKEWRPNQTKAITDALDTDKRFVAQSAPTGSGKSVTAVTQSLLHGGRTVYLTSTKGLQQQLIEDFSDMGAVSVSGKSAYTCPSGDGWTCHEGHLGQCSLRGTMACEYTRDYEKALSANIVVTNYSLWVSINKYGKGLGEFDLLIMDEAHHAPDELSNILQLKISFNEVNDILKTDFPKNPDNPGAWKYWAKEKISTIQLLIKNQEQVIRDAREARQSWIQHLSHLQNMERNYTTLALINPDDWIVESDSHGYRLDAIRPGAYAEKMLYMGIPKVLFTSATIRTKTLNMLGVYRDYKFFDYQSDFDKDDMPIWQVPTCKINANTTYDGYNLWLSRADEIITRRLDRKGIFHTVSYQRRDKVIEESEYSYLMYTNRKGDITSDVVKDFKEAPTPAVLVSPSVTTGYDFPGDHCRYIIIGKIPFPDHRIKIIEARNERDREYSAYLTMQKLVQMAGRGNRSLGDRCEILIIDDCGENFIRRYKHLAPEWFWRFYQPWTGGGSPKPLKLI